MQPTNVNVAFLFGNKVQYRIPLFQRHYVWGMEDQWQPLWEDIEKRSNQRFSEHKRDRFSHFTGAIVIQQKTTNVDEVKKYEVIDGQQRITTFQIILCALRDICFLKNFTDISEEVDSYTLNKGMLSKDYEYEQYKLIPTEFDRCSFREIIDCKPQDNSVKKNGLITEAYNYFKQKIINYTEENREKILPLFHAILNDFCLVQILIDSDDEPEMIFESLNARGKSLLQFDLLRNNLFLRTRISEEDRDSLYQKYWSHFETTYWESEINLGRRNIILSELFLQHFLMAKLSTDSVSPLFKSYQREYRKGLENASSTLELSELSRYSQIYKEINDCDNSSDIGKRMRFYKIFDINSLHPFILFIKAEINPNECDISLIFNILESYTIRRILCTSQGHKNYNKFFSEVIKKIKRCDSVVHELIKILSEQSSNTTKWPDDHEVKNSLHGHWAQINVNRNVLRYILYRIELMKRGENNFIEKDEMPFRQFTLEHIMPDKWKQYWLLPFGEGKIKYEDMFSKEYKKSDTLWDLFPSKENLINDSYQDAFELASDRSSLIQSLGNLTVVTGKLNSSLSNSPFEQKKESLFGNSTLLVNKEICKNEVWDVGEIKKREGTLYENFCKLWPNADEFIKKIT